MNIKDKITALIGIVAFILIIAIILGVMLYIAIGVWGQRNRSPEQIRSADNGGVTWLSGN